MQHLSPYMASLRPAISSTVATAGGTLDTYCPYLGAKGESNCYNTFASLYAVLSRGLFIRPGGPGFPTAFSTPLCASDETGGAKRQLARRQTRSDERGLGLAGDYLCSSVPEAKLPSPLCPSATSNLGRE